MLLKFPNFDPKPSADVSWLSTSCQNGKSHRMKSHLLPLAMHDWVYVVKIMHGDFTFFPKKINVK